jgi:flagellar motor switch protein FliM
MSLDNLSQSDLDRLLGGGAKAGANKRGSSDLDVQRYDFRRPHRISKERLRTIEAMYERMVKNMESFLMARLRGQLEVRVQSVEQFSFGEFTQSLIAPCASYVMDINGPEGLQGVIDFGPDFAYYLVDRLFGGGGSPTVLQRPLSSLEQDAVRIVGDRIAAIVQEVWQEVMPLNLEIVAFESSPEMLQACAKEDPVLVTNIEIKSSEVSSLVMVCLPFASLEQYFTSSEVRRVSTTVRSEEELRAQRTNAEASVRRTSVKVAARLPAFRLTMKDLTQLQPGAVINTGISTDSLLSITVAEQPRMVATAGRSAGKLAARIAEGRIAENRITGTLTPADTGRS